MSAKPMQGVFFSCGILLSATQVDTGGTPISSWVPPAGAGYLYGGFSTNVDAMKTWSMKSDDNLVSFELRPGDVLYKDRKSTRLNSSH